jgi:hypothetical protein
MATDNVANLYELQGDKVLVTYSTTNIAGQPLFTLQLGRKTLTFKKSEIKTTKSPVGTLVTVLTETVPDLRTVTFTLVLPDINLQQSTKVNTRAIGIVTTSKTSIGGPTLVKGAVQSYKVVTLSGTAKIVQSVKGNDTAVAAGA